MADDNSRTDSDIDMDFYSCEGDDNQDDLDQNECDQNGRTHKKFAVAGTRQFEQLTATDDWRRSVLNIEHKHGMGRTRTATNCQTTQVVKFSGKKLNNASECELREGHSGKFAWLG